MKRKPRAIEKWITEVHVTGKSAAVHASALEMMDDHLRHGAIETREVNRAHDRKVWRLTLERLAVKS